MATGSTVIVGGTSGLGRHLAERFAGSGRDVVITGRSPQRTEAIAREIGGSTSAVNRSGGRVRWLESQSPQPPSNHSYRFNRDWEYLGEQLSAAG